MPKIEGRLRGAFQEGYTPDAVNQVLGPVSWANGQRLVVLWEYIDDYGPGGDSDLRAVGVDGRLRELHPEVLAFLFDEQGPGADLVVASLDQRRAAWQDPTGFTELDGHNFARLDRRTS